MSDFHSTSPAIHLTRGRAGCELAVRLGAVAIVVDALRASTTLAALLDHGVARIQVVARVNHARALAAQSPEALLIGERGGQRIPGFHLGNSPLEVLASPRMEGLTAIFTSSNGAQRLTACHGAHHILVGTVSNAAVVCETARALAETARRPVVCIAAGKYPDESYIAPEDEITCTYLAARIGLPIAGESIADFSRWQRELILHGLEAIFRSSRHAQRLMEIGYGDDVLFCTRPDSLPLAPAVSGDVLLHDKRVGVEIRAAAGLRTRKAEA